MVLLWHTCIHWQASVASETYIGLEYLDFVAKYIYIPYMVRETHFSSAGTALCNVGGIRCQSFLTTGNEMF